MANQRPLSGSVKSKFSWRNPRGRVDWGGPIVEEKTNEYQTGEKKDKNVPVNCGLAKKKGKVRCKGEEWETRVTCGTQAELVRSKGRGSIQEEKVMRREVD